MTNHRRGTTLVELIVVLFLLALLMGLVVPALTAVPRQVSGGAAMDSLRLASVQAGRPLAHPATDSMPAFYGLPDGRIVGAVRDSAH